MIGAALLPASVVVAAGEITSEFPDDRALPHPLRRAAASRQREFVSGRRAAAVALAALEVRGEVGIGAGGEPHWPAGTVGSITHSATQAWCAAGRTRDVAGLGIDVEPPMPAARAARVRDRIVRRDEMARPGWPSSWDTPLRLTLAFSAKEALYKCLFPQVGRVFDFLDVSVAHVDAGTGQIGLRLRRDLSPDWRRGDLLDGRFDIAGTLVATAFVLEP